MDFAWAINYPEIQRLCERFNLTEISNPQQVRYKHFEGILQDGPQCGLVALATIMGKPTKPIIHELLQQSQSAGYTFNGEMFSAKDMYELASHNLPNKVTLYDGFLDSNEIKEFLLNDGLILVPYDCDRNHTPCNNKGHTAHWALISGIIQTALKVYVVAKHGKSANIAIWGLTELAESNAQLEELSPDRKSQDVSYKLPEDGISGPNGLMNKAVCIWPNDVAC